MMIFRPLSLIGHYYTPPRLLEQLALFRKREPAKKKPSAKAGDIAKEMKVRNCRVQQSATRVRNSKASRLFLIATILF
jgi:hypothetical protein